MYPESKCFVTNTKLVETYIIGDLYFGLCLTNDLKNYRMTQYDIFYSIFVKC